MSHAIIRGDARHLPLPDASVDLIVTSPPYWALRSYTDGGAHYGGQIGSEGTPQEFVAALVECVAEMVRVLKPSGSIFLNLGDKYATAAGPKTGEKSGLRTNANGHAGGPKWAITERGAAAAGFREKSLLGLPWRVALACTDQLGLILRAEIIWAKPNGLPESVGDRVRRAHEQIFHFTVRPRYYTAVDEIREAGARETPHRRPSPNKGDIRHGGDANRSAHLGADGWIVGQVNPLGKLPGSVWTIPSAPLVVPASLGVDHFAAFPPALVRPIILGWSPAGICTACGEGRRPVMSSPEYIRLGQRRNQQNFPDSRTERNHNNNRSDAALPFGTSATKLATITGYACACPASTAPTRPAVVLDPFGGTGTTALVATVHGRHGITVDLSADYCRLAQWRVNDPGERARALDVPKPPPIPDGMDPLFEVG